MQTIKKKNKEKKSEKSMRMPSERRKKMIVCAEGTNEMDWNDDEEWKGETNGDKEMNIYQYISILLYKYIILYIVRIKNNKNDIAYWTCTYFEGPDFFFRKRERERGIWKKMCIRSTFFDF